MKYTETNRYLFMIFLYCLQGCSTSYNTDKPIGRSLQEAKNAQTLRIDYKQPPVLDLMSREISANFNAYLQGGTVQSAGEDKILIENPTSIIRK